MPLADGVVTRCPQAFPEDRRRQNSALRNPLVRSKLWGSIGHSHRSTIRFVRRIWTIQGLRAQRLLIALSADFQAYLIFCVVIVCDSFFCFVFDGFAIWKLCCVWFCVWNFSLFPILLRLSHKFYSGYAHFCWQEFAFPEVHTIIFPSFQFKCKCQVLLSVEYLLKSNEVSNQYVVHQHFCYFLKVTDLDFLVSV